MKTLPQPIVKSPDKPHQSLEKPSRTHKACVATNGKDDTDQPNRSQKQENLKTKLTNDLHYPKSFTTNELQAKPSPQAFKNGEVHDWYRIVLGFSDHLVADLLAEMSVPAEGAIIDPFSGSGTTAVECKKRNINCWAIDANPAGYFATKVKTNWQLSPNSLLAALEMVVAEFPCKRKHRSFLSKDPTFTYIQDSGMLDRNWITKSNLLDIIALKKCIHETPVSKKYQDALTLALMHEIVHTSSNVHFGPTLYCVPDDERVHALPSFQLKVKKIAKDLELAKKCDTKSKTKVLLGDSRFLDPKWIQPPSQLFDAVICSPPYPTEHDYTRNARLELALLESINDRASLQTIKRRMIRSNTKGIYIEDKDCDFVSTNEKINSLAARIEIKAAGKKHGFARLYGRVLRTYFGGMKRHLSSLLPLLKPSAPCAYVVGDQSSYFQVKIPTAEILSEIAAEVGFKVEGIRVWRTRWSTATRSTLKENILLLKR